jgi:hypothetical protein
VQQSKKTHYAHCLNSDNDNQKTLKKQKRQEQAQIQ